MPVSLGNSATRILSAFVLSAFALICPTPSSAQTSSGLASPALLPVSASHAETGTPIVIGFLGGHVDHTNVRHAEVQLAQKLRDEFGSGINAETFENRRYPEAYDRIVSLLDTDKDGHLSAEEKRRARIILYGHSWGAAAVVALARELQAHGIPVRLTVQVDSVAHFGQDDSVIPPNVAKAVNFYQLQGPIRGKALITPGDPTHTQILGNFRFDYSPDAPACTGYPWWDRYLMKGHIEIECDPKVWSQVESLIRAELLPAGSDRTLASNPSPALPASQP
jgi:pimeloyl-ACP methyl ester carboxylesterase